MSDQAIPTTNAAVLVCSVPLAQELTEARIAPTFIGVRNVHEVRRQGKSAFSVTIPITYKVMNPDGTERRMTSKEKKEARLKRVEEKRKAVETLKEQQRLERERKKQKIEQDNTEEEHSNEEHSKAVLGSSVDERYHLLSVSKVAMEEEMAEHSDRRENKVPILLSPSMALCASSTILKQQSQGYNEGSFMIQYDHELSQRWAETLKASMSPAEIVRQAEDMRPMAYHCVPEVWTRMRPERTITHPSKIKMQKGTEIVRSLSAPSPKSLDDKKSWVAITCRPTSDLDQTSGIVMEYLYKETNFHVSCGAKFGADFLVYDGPRSQRHAFCGLRIAKQAPSNGDLPILSPYKLAGYVRGLNTAGKLALLATVMKETAGDKVIYKVAIVDLALEKILTAPTHQRHGRDQKRRDVTKNLAKTK